MTLGFTEYLIIICYFLFIITKGILKSRQIKTQDDFLVAGRSIGWFFLLCTMSATVIGGGASVGAMGKTYEWGILMLVVSTGWYLHFIFSGWFVAPRFREAELYTVAGYFEHRYDGKSRFYVFILSLLFSIGILGAQMVAFGKIITSFAPDLPYYWAVIIGGGMVILYSTAGGLLAVINTDVYQFIILMIGFIYTLILCLPDISNGLSNASANIPETFFQIDGGKGWLFLISTFLAFFLGETFAPGYATRYCVGKNISETRKGIVGAGIFLALTFPVILLGIAYFARINFIDIDPEKALPLTILKLNNPVLGGLIIAALISAVMSSADSILNSSTAIFTKDFLDQYFTGRLKNPKKDLFLARSSSLFIGVLGIILALLLPDIIDLLLITYSLWAPNVIVPVVVGIFRKERSHELNNLILTTMIISSISTLYFMYSSISETIQPGILGLIISIITYYTGSFIIKYVKS
jgi:SSS family solute:Na+ symporter